MKHTAWMQCDSWHRVHVGLCDVLDDDRDVEVPCADGLVIRRRHKPPVLVDEGDCVHRAKVLVVFLRDFSRVYVVLLYASSGARTLRLQRP